MYLTPTGSIEDYTQVDSTKVTDNFVKYGPYKKKEAYSFDLISILFKSVEPQLIL